MKNIKFSIACHRDNADLTKIGQSNFFSVADLNLSPTGGSAIFDVENILAFNGGNIISTCSLVLRLEGVEQDKYYMQFYISGDSISGYAYSLNTTGSGFFDLWSSNTVMNRAPIVTDIPDPFTNFAFFNYALPDNYLTLVSSWQCLPSVVTVGNYTNRMTWVDYNGNSQTQTSCGYTPVTPGKIGTSSSLGPTRTGYQKPDITASGDFTFTSSRLSSATSLISSNPCKVAQGGMHNFNGGTSMSSPVVAGFAALYLQKYPNASYQDFLTHIKNTGKDDIQTGAVPNNSWGYGKLDGFMAIQQNFVGNEDFENDGDFKIFPNPTNGELNILIKNFNEREIIINIYNNFGQLIYNDKINNDYLMISKNISLSEMPKGIYYFEAIGGSFNKKRPLIID